MTVVCQRTAMFRLGLQGDESYCKQIKRVYLAGDDVPILQVP